MHCDSVWSFLFFRYRRCSLSIVMFIRAVKNSVKVRRRTLCLELNWRQLKIGFEGSATLDITHGLRGHACLGVSNDSGFISGEKSSWLSTWGKLGFTGSFESFLFEFSGTTINNLILLWITSLIIPENNSTVYAVKNLMSQFACL